MCRLSGEEKWYSCIHDWRSFTFSLQYKYSIRPHENTWACLCMQAYVWTVQHFLFWRSAGHRQNFPRSGFIRSIVCVHILYACICLYMCPSWNLVLWNCVRACEIDCGAAAGLLSPYFIEIDLTGHCSMRSIMASIPKLPPTKRCD